MNIRDMLYSPIIYISEKIKYTYESKQTLKRFLLYFISCLYICFVGAISSFLIWALFQYPQIIKFIFILCVFFFVGFSVLYVIKK